MRVSKATWIAVVLGLGAGGFALHGSIQSKDELAAAKKEMNDFCRSTTTSIHADRSALRSGKPSLQKEAIQRIIADRIYFGDSSAQICLKKDMPNADEWNGCLFSEDVPCVLARTEKLYKLLSKEYAE
jgi:hypothetical protein